MLWKLAIAIVIGYVLIGISMAFDPQRPPLDWKSAQLAAGLPDRHGHHLLAGPVQRRGVSEKHPLPPTNTFNIPFWWDMLVVAGFSLIIYFWAHAGEAVPGGNARTWSTGRPARRPSRRLQH